MTDRSPPSAHRRIDRGADEATALVAEMRAGVEAAARQLDELVAELGEQRSRVDQLETVVDHLLGVTEATVLVIDDGGRITGLSRGSAERLDGAAVGKPLSSVLAAPIVDQIADALGGDHERAIELPAGDGVARVSHLPGGGAVLVLSAS